MDTNGEVIHVALIDNDPSFAHVTGQYLNAESEELSKEFGIKFQVDDFTLTRVVDRRLVQELSQLDVLLVGMDPRDANVLERLHTECKSFDCVDKLIFVSGTDDPRLVQFATRVGNRRILEKPVVNREFKALFKQIHDLYNKCAKK